MRAFFEWLVSRVDYFLVNLFMPPSYDQDPAEQPVNQEPVPLPEPPTPKYLWDTKEHIRHSIRVICDEMELSVPLKNTMCATIYGESGFDLNAINHNKDANGKILSTDYGLCQWNDHYHGNEISPLEAVHDPEKAVRLMARYWKLGETYRKWWIAYKNGRYKQFLKLTQNPIP